ncbi:MAG: ribonuclease P protein component [Bacteroidales bacterium]|nr:ribonuclease P protein component [Bacteroidales bacterium]
MNHKLRLYKKEKLCSNTAINMLFRPEGSSQATLAYPLRAVWRQNDGRYCDAKMQFLISIPKKRLHHAVDRVMMRRRIREAYRLNHHDYTLTDNSKIDVAFIYIANSLLPYKIIEKAMKKILKNISENYLNVENSNEKDI